MSFWTLMCPVCGEELPERGNRRVYVPWKRGFKLVHADDCAGLIEAQGVLDVAAAARKPSRERQIVTLALMRRLAKQVPPQPVEGAGHSREELLAIARCVARLDKDQTFTRGPGGQKFEYKRLSGAELIKVARAVFHAEEYSGRAGRLLA